MLGLAHLRREERLGLGIAAAAHVALLAALVLRGTQEQPLIPPAERMEVSLASEVSLESTAPDPSEAPQAAVAPVFAPESAPPPTPETEPVERQERPAIERPVRSRPAPAPTPTARATSRPTEEARPQPRPTQRSGGGSRLGDDFLEGVSASEREETGTPAASFGSAERAALQAAINRQLRPHWNAPNGVDVDRLDTTLVWDLNPDGSLKGTPRLVDQEGITDSNRAQAKRHIEQAVRAVRLAAPFDLPPEFYNHWKRLTWHFDRNLSR